MTDRNGSQTLTFRERMDATPCEGPQNNELPEAEAVRRAQRGDAAGFERLYQLHSRRVYALCLRLVTNAAEAEDLTQEAFLRVFRKIRLFRGKSAFSTWLHRLALNVVFMQLRKKNLPETPLETKAKIDGQVPVPRNEVGRTDTSLTGVLDRINLERALKHLPWPYKIVFVLHDIQGYKHQEIARMMDWSVGTSKGHLHRARRRLRKLLQEGDQYLTLLSGSPAQVTRYSPTY